MTFTGIVQLIPSHDQVHSSIQLQWQCHSLSQAGMEKRIDLQKFAKCNKNVILCSWSYTQYSQMIINTERDLFLISKFAARVGNIKHHQRIIMSLVFWKIRTFLFYIPCHISGNPDKEMSWCYHLIVISFLSLLFSNQNLISFFFFFNF